MEIFVHRKDSETIEEGFTPDKLHRLLEDKTNVVWIDFEISNNADAEIAEDILLNVFKFHHLTVEDCREDSKSAEGRSISKVSFLHHSRHQKRRQITANFVNQRTRRIFGR